MQNTTTGTKRFKSWIRNELLWLPRHLMIFAILLAGMYIADLAFKNVAFGWFEYAALTGMFLIPYAIQVYFQLGRNHHDFIVEKEVIRVVNRVPGFRRQSAIPIADIREIVFTEDSWQVHRFHLPSVMREVFRHPERKWIIIRTEDKEHRWACFGMEFDCYDENFLTPTYDDFFHYLGLERGIPVSWERPAA